MDLRPVDPYRAEDFTDAQFAVRLALAKKMCQFLLDVDDSLTPEYRSSYERAPMWATYTMLPNGKSHPRRVYGMCTSLDDKGDEVASAHAVTGFHYFNNDVIGGVPIADLEHNKVDRLYYADVMFTKTPGLFMDPLGFIGFLHAHYGH